MYTFWALLLSIVSTYIWILFILVTYKFQLKISNLSGSTLFETNFKNASEGFASVYSPNGNITGQTVFVNFAEEEDFRMLRENKVEYKNKIFVARCGKIHLDDMVSNYVLLHLLMSVTCYKYFFFFKCHIQNEGWQLSRDLG